YALREAAKPFITKTIYERQKHPFLAPPAFLSGKKNLMSVLIEDTLRSTTMQKIPYIDQKAVIALLDNYDQFNEEEKAKYDLLLMSLTSACMLQKRLGG
ncbi:MAG TPA: asparagine synthase-related protein, partial [Puia sp.]|nr:asparagine synthase-related protein [Puia sp.]